MDCESVIPQKVCFLCTTEGRSCGCNCEKECSCFETDDPRESSALDMVICNLCKFHKIWDDKIANGYETARKTNPFTQQDKTCSHPPQIGYVPACSYCWTGICAKERVIKDVVKERTNQFKAAVSNMLKSFKCKLDKNLLETICNYNGVMFLAKIAEDIEKVNEVLQKYYHICKRPTMRSLIDEGVKDDQIEINEALKLKVLAKLDPVES